MAGWRKGKVNKMELRKLFDMQKELDEKIVREKGLKDKDLLSNKILALQVELGELANEWRGFKFWSNNREPRTNLEIVCRECHGTGTPLGIPAESGVDCWKCEGAGTYFINPLLEEYVDCLHFILSIGIEIDSDYKFYFGNFNDVWETKTKFLDEKLSLTEVFIELIENARWEMGTNGYWMDFLESFTDIGKRLGLTPEEVLKAYMDKNKVNHERQKVGY